MYKSSLSFSLALSLSPDKSSEVWYEKSNFETFWVIRVYHQDGTKTNWFIEHSITWMLSLPTHKHLLTLMEP